MTHRTPDMSRFQRFTLYRSDDVTGMSGTGTVAAGVVFPDGTCAMRWLTETNSTSLYDSLHDILTIHGHNGATSVRLVDEKGNL